MTHPHQDTWDMVEKAAHALRDFANLHQKMVAPRIVVNHWDRDDKNYLRMGNLSCDNKESDTKRRFRVPVEETDAIFAYNRDSYPSLLEKIGLSGHDRVIFTIEMQKLTLSWQDLQSYLFKIIPAFESHDYRLGLERQIGAQTTTLYMAGCPFAVVHDTKTKKKYKSMFLDLVSLLESAPKDKRFVMTMNNSHFYASEKIIIPAQDLRHADAIAALLVWPQSSSFYKISPEKTHE